MRLANSRLMLAPEYEPSAARAVATVKRLRTRAAVLSFLCAVAAAFLPITAAIAIEPGQGETALISSAAVAVTSWAAYRRARRDREHARELEHAIEHLLVKPESSVPQP
jgi:uncharacterized iron-regulated protein